MKSMVVTCVFLASLFSPRVQPGAQVLVDLAVDSADVEIAGAADWQAGLSLAAGDIDGDGVDDLVITAPRSLPFNGTREGEVIVLWGPISESVSNIDLSSIPTTDALRIIGRSTDFPRFGQVGVGDFDGDGFDDIVYSQPWAPFPATDGLVYVIFGSDALPDTIDLAAPSGSYSRILGPPSSSLLGASFCACDINGDGFEELVLSSPSMGTDQLTVVHGASSLLPVYDLANPIPGAVTIIVDDLPENWAGSSLACEDLDNDGFGDLVYGTSGGLAGEGVVTILYSNGTLPDTLDVLNSPGRVRRVFGEPYPDGRLGTKVNLGDVDGNGRWDLIASAPYADPDQCLDCGVVYVLRNAADLPDTTDLDVDIIDGFQMVGEITGLNYGLGLATGDMDSDGCDEVQLVSLGNSSNANSRARTVIVPGGTADTTIAIDSDSSLSRVFDRIPKDGLGRGLAVGDLNHDGAGDLALGANWAHAMGRNNSGTVYVFFGEAVPSHVSGVPPAPIRLQQNYPNPFSRATTIEFDMPVGGPVEIVIYDIAGRRVATLLSSGKSGRNQVTWNGLRDDGVPVASGMYFYRLHVEGGGQTRKMLILR